MAPIVIIKHQEFFIIEITCIFLIKIYHFFFFTLGSKYTLFYQNYKKRNSPVSCQILDNYSDLYAFSCSSYVMYSLSNEHCSDISVENTTLQNKNKPHVNRFGDFGNYLKN